MKYLIVFKLAANELLNNKLRTSITSIGIIIGVAAVITTISLTQGAKQQVENQFLNLGGKSLIIMPGDQTGSGINKPGNKIQFTVNDVKSIKGIDKVEYTAPIIRVTRLARFGNKNLFTVIVGTSSDFFYLNNWFTSKGTIFTDEDNHNSETVCVLGSTVAESLFGSQDPVGNKLRIENTVYTVTGVLKSIGQTTSGRDQDDVIIIPYTTIQKRIVGSNIIESISISVKNPSELQSAQFEITQLLRTNHNISQNMLDGFYIKTQEDVLKRIDNVSSIMTYLLVLIASISLLVGGMGIMNIMLVSVIERTKEIGVRMAIGAKQNDIVIQFIAESLIISVIGGVLGIITGISSSKIATLFTSWPTSTSIGAVLISFFFSAFIGIFFGYYPAKKASNLDPIEALRYE
jgi:putative ABC transport system permease protein